MPGLSLYAVGPESLTFPTLVSPTTLASMATGATGRPLWPSDISGLILWLPADQIQGIASGASLSAWTDSSLSGSHATQASVVSQPVFFPNVQNGLSAVSFGGASTMQLLQSPTSSFDTCTFAAVVQPSNLTSATEGYVGGSSGNALRVTKTGGNAAPTVATVIGNITGSGLGAAWQTLIESFSTQGGASMVTLTQSGVTFASSAMSGGGVQSPLLNIGRTTSSVQTLRGWIGEVLVYNRPLFEVERASLDSYLRTKWAI